MIAILFQTAVESVENIETVSSLGLEERMYRYYEQKIKKPTRYLHAASIWLYGLTL